MGASVCVLTRRSDPLLPKFELQGSVGVHRLWPTGPGQFKKWGLVLSTGPALLRLRREYDLVFVSGFRIVGMVAVLVAKLLGKRVVLKADSQGEMSGEFFSAGLSRAGISASSRLFRLFLRARNAILRRADAFVAITPDIEAEFVNAGIPTGKVQRVPNGVDTHRFQPLDGLGQAGAQAETGPGGRDGRDRLYGSAGVLQGTAIAAQGLAGDRPYAAGCPAAAGRRGRAGHPQLRAGATGAGSCRWLGEQRYIRRQRRGRVALPAGSRHLRVPDRERCLPLVAGGGHGVWGARRYDTSGSNRDDRAETGRTD